MKRFISFRQKRFLRIHALFLLFHLSFFTFHATSQPPQGISYQAIITDEADQPLEFSLVGIKVSILAGGGEGTVVYAETHSVNTDQIGHVSLVIGTGDVVSGSFAGILWADGMFWVKIETDPLGGTNYTISGTSQFLSVPYAFVALTSLEPGPEGPPGKDGILADGTAAGNTTFWDGIQWVVDSNNLFHDGSRVGIGTDTPAAHLHVNGEGTVGGGNVLFEGIFTTTPLAPPASGPGTRMMWYPGKAAFRAGHVTETQWDLSNIGRYSVAMGFNTIASGDYSTAMGINSTASGGASIAAGNNAVASEDFSIAIGSRASASGRHSTAFGYETSALSYGETVIGVYSTSYTPVYSPGWHDRDRLFIIGNGRSPTDRRNAMTILKNGNTGIGTDTPTALLHTNGTGTGGGNVLFAGSIKTTPGAPPATGAGTRMMWYPDKAAFRAGGVAGAQWDMANTGNYSLAVGYNTQASGAFASAIGENTSALSGYETVVGRFNTLYTPLSTTEWNAGDRLFVVGRGTSATLRLNALTILKNGNTGIGTDTPTALLHTNGIGTGEGNVLFAGSFKGTPGAPPVTGAGTRMMWYPDKAAFRAGRVTGAQWDMGNIGNNSVAMGINAIASGNHSIALGNTASASGLVSVAIGNSTTASGSSSTAMGSSTTASGISSTAMGGGTIASGNYSTAMGRNARAVGAYSFAINLANTIGPDVGANTFRISGSTSIGGNLAWTNHSDRRLKKEIVAIGSENNLSKILRLNAVRYRWIEHDQLLNLGFIAQDVLEIVPESVRYDELNDIYSMEYTALIPLLVEGMKEQQAVIERQQVVMNNQQDDITGLKETLDKLQQQNIQLLASMTEMEKLKAEVDRIKELFLVKE